MQYQMHNELSFTLKYMNNTQLDRIRLALLSFEMNQFVILMAETIILLIMQLCKMFESYEKVFLNNHFYDIKHVITVHFAKKIIWDRKKATSQLDP